MKKDRHLTFLILVLIGWLFLTGRGVCFGIEGVEPILITLPKSEVLGWSSIILGFLYMLPPAWTVRVFRFLKNKIKGERNGCYTTTYKNS